MNVYVANFDVSIVINACVTRVLRSTTSPRLPRRTCSFDLPETSNLHEAAWSMAMVVGPGLAGLLSEPVKYYPRVFSESGLFGR